MCSKPQLHLKTFTKCIVCTFIVIKNKTSLYLTLDSCLRKYTLVFLE